MSLTDTRTVRLGKTCAGGTFGFSIGKFHADLCGIHTSSCIFYNWRILHLFSFPFLYLFPLSSLGPSGKRAHVISRVNKDVAHLLQHGDELLSVNGRPTNGMAHENVIQQVSKKRGKRREKREEKREKRITISHLSHFSLSRDHPLPSTRAVGSSLYLLHVSWYCYGRLCNVPDAPFHRLP